MTFDLNALSTAVAEHGTVARVLVAKVAGSAPRNAGTAMLVWKDGQAGTIGGGQLEYDATRIARDLLTQVGYKVEQFPLGPKLGQCCGGSVTLVTEVFNESTLPTSGDFARKIAAVAGNQPNALPNPVLQNGWLVEKETHPTRDIWIYGAGHVGRALVATLTPLPDLNITWVDTAADRFPSEIPVGVTELVAADPSLVVKHAPAHAEHLVLTYSHQIDFALCHAILSHSFKDAGVIGSATKWTRFKKRLNALGHANEHITRIACPIGDPSLGKHPQEIAIGVAMAMLSGAQSKGAAETA